MNTSQMTRQYSVPKTSTSRPVRAWSFDRAPRKTTTIPSRPITKITWMKPAAIIFRNAKKSAMTLLFGFEAVRGRRSSRSGPHKRTYQGAARRTTPREGRVASRRGCADAGRLAADARGGDVLAVLRRADDAVTRPGRARFRLRAAAPRRRRPRPPLRFRRRAAGRARLRLLHLTALPPPVGRAGGAARAPRRRGRVLHRLHPRGAPRGRLGPRGQP